jgi:predicted RNase H-like HicB family nuclease
MRWTALHALVRVDQRSRSMVAVDPRRFAAIIEWDPADEVWVTHVPALGHLSTYGETRDEALEQTREAMLGYLEAAAKERIRVPVEDVPAEFVEIDVAAS